MTDHLAEADRLISRALRIERHICIPGGKLDRLARCRCAQRQRGTCSTSGATRAATPRSGRGSNLTWRRMVDKGSGSVSIPKRYESN